MAEIFFNLTISATVISLVLWISKSNPTLAGFVLSLPISTLIVLALSKLQNKDPGNTLLLAKSVMIGVPASLLFFVPFLFADKLKLNFWSSYMIGFLLLTVSYLIHKWLVNQI